jgi:hypothetical protein
MTIRVRRHPSHADHRGPRSAAGMTVTCRHELPSVAVVAILVGAARAGHRGISIGTQLTRAAATDLIHAALRDAGAGAVDGWDAGLGPDELRRSVRWAAGQIRRLWPALADPPLAELVAAHAPPLLDTLADDPTSTTR